MRIAAAPPAYLPSGEFFRRMARVDHFVLADDLRYSSGSGINRAALPGPEGRRWLTVPVLSKGRGGQRIDQVTIDATRNWRQKHRKTLLATYQYAPYFPFYQDHLTALLQRNWQSLAALNQASIVLLRELLGISTPLSGSSRLSLPETAGPTARIVALVQALGGRAYLARDSDRTFLDPGQFAEAGLELAFLSPPSSAAVTFRPQLSALDLLFYHGPTARRLL